MKKENPQQLQLNETFANIEDLQAGDRIRLSQRNTNVYVVHTHFFDETPETKVKLSGTHVHMFIPHGRKVIKILI